MASKYLTVMLSSRCNDPIEFEGTTKTFTDVRLAAKNRIELIKIGGERIYQVWINEIAPAEEGTTDSWDKCLVEARECDLFIVIYNGNAGWANSDGDIGICHAELQEAFDQNPNKVHLIELDSIPSRLAGRDKMMKRYKESLNLFRNIASTGEELLQTIEKLIGAATRKLAKHGVGDAGSSTYHLGAPMDWSRMDFVSRKAAMENVLTDSLSAMTGNGAVSGGVFVKLQNKEVMFRCHGIPSAMSVASARELVGQPFLNDYEYAGSFTAKKIGPVHLVACHKGVSESQAINMLGFADAIIVDIKIGIYVADQIQKTQLILLKNCRDRSSTAHAVQRMFAWLDRAQETQNLVSRAQSRTKICKAIASEIT